jgi:membrane protease YdiL (CAAX protease family)
MNGWTVTLLLLLIAPVLEEFVLRAGLQSAFSRKDFAKTCTNVAVFDFSSAPVRITVVALLFSLAHLPRGLWLALGTFPVALFIGWWFERRHNWIECAAIHSAANAIWIFAVPNAGASTLLNKTFEGL